MSLSSINLLVDELSNKYIDTFLSTGFNVFTEGGINLTQEAQNAYEHYGLYAFTLTKNTNTGVVYVGKSEGDDRLRQHLTGNNKNGSKLATSVRTKHNEITKATRDGYIVKLSLLSDQDLKKSSLSCLEIECILKGIEQLLSTPLVIPPWNKRIG